MSEYKYAIGDVSGSGPLHEGRYFFNACEARSYYAKLLGPGEDVFILEAPWVDSDDYEWVPMHWEVE